MYEIAVENKVKKWKKKLPQTAQEIINACAEQVY